MLERIIITVKGYKSEKLVDRFKNNNNMFSHWESLISINAVLSIGPAIVRKLWKQTSLHVNLREFQ